MWPCGLRQADALQHLDSAGVGDVQQLNLQHVPDFCRP
jgi:hypothetical protein